MQNSLTTYSATLRTVSLFSASNEYLTAVLHGRCDQAKLVDDLRDLLGLYYQPNETAEQRARQIALFVKDLSDMSDDAVSWAIEDWRRKEDRRPSPASLRQRCMMRREEAVRAMRAASSPKRDAAPCHDFSPLSDAEREKRQAVFDRCAKAAGMVRHGGRFTFPSLVEGGVKRQPHWTETASQDDPRWESLYRARAANGLLGDQT